MELGSGSASGEKDLGDKETDKDGTPEKGPELVVTVPEIPLPVLPGPEVEQSRSGGRSRGSGRSRGRGRGRGRGQGRS